MIGPNGAGKSTLLGALAGDRPLAKGRCCSTASRSRNGARRRSPIGGPCCRSIRRSPSTSPACRSPRLGLLAHRDRCPTGRCGAVAEQALAETEALAFADRPYTVLSGGERQRVQLARVLAQCDADPAARPFLLLDEPIAGLDLAHQHAALASARRRADRGLGVLAVLHDLNMAARYADRVAIIEERPPDGAGTDPARPSIPERLSAVFATPIVRLQAGWGNGLPQPGLETPRTRT